MYQTFLFSHSDWIVNCLLNLSNVFATLTLKLKSHQSGLDFAVGKGGVRCNAAIFGSLTESRAAIAHQMFENFDKIKHLMTNKQTFDK